MVACLQFCISVSDAANTQPARGLTESTAYDSRLADTLDPSNPVTISEHDLASSTLAWLFPTRRAECAPQRKKTLEANRAVDRVSSPHRHAEHLCGAAACLAIVMRWD